MHTSQSKSSLSQNDQKMPAHWVLAKLGKRVLRPGGLKLSKAMLDQLAITPGDDVIEFAPGLGATARLALAREPASYTAIERDEAAADYLQSRLTKPYCCLVASAEKTGLADACASVVYGEAMLSMQSARQKADIIKEAFRLLKPGGRYAVHELSLLPDAIDEASKLDILRDLTRVLRVNARPLTVAEWRELLELHGFKVEAQIDTPMYLLEPQRILADEGLLRTFRIVYNLARYGTARRRVLLMRQLFQKYRAQLGVISLIATRSSTVTKPS